MKIHAAMQEKSASVAVRILEREADKLEAAVKNHSKSSRSIRPSERAMALVDVQYMRAAARALRQARTRAHDRDIERRTSAG